METRIALELFVLILLAKVGEEISVRLRQPSLIGQLIMGILLGMVARQMDLHETEWVDAFAHMGVWLLLFLAGLEMNLTMIKSLGAAAIGVALAGVIVPMAGGFA